MAKEMNEDIVRAREVLHNIGGHDYDSCGNYPLERREAEKVIYILNAFISKKRWIPVSELPKENGWYQCAVILNDLPQTMELFYKNGKWLDNRRISMFNTYDIYGYGNTKEKHKLSYQELISEFDWTENVIAWQPLPEPYKAESEEI